MLIQSFSNKFSASVNAYAAGARRYEELAASKVSYQSLSGEDKAIVDSYSPQAMRDQVDSMGRGFTYGLLGVIPGLGAASNVVNAISCGADGNVRSERKAMLGAVSNTIGTYCLMVGASSGSMGALVAGVSLLGVSSLAGAQAAYNA